MPTKCFNCGQEFTPHEYTLTDYSGSRMFCCESCHSSYYIGLSMEAEVDNRELYYNSPTETEQFEEF